MADTMKAKITVLSPVHIGSGKGELIYDYDFIFDNGFFHIIDHEKMFEQIDETSLLSDSIDVHISKLLKSNQYKKCSKYSLYCIEKNIGSIDKIYDHIKDVHSRPYIPGSSIKGAIRTALAYAMINGGITNLNIKDMLVYTRDNRLINQKADDETEKRLFGESPKHDGKDANYDIMRALHISDTKGLSKGIVLSKVGVYSIRDNQLSSKNMSTYREVIPKNKELEFSIKLDKKMLSDEMFKELNFSTEKIEYLEKYPEYCNAFAEKIIENEIKFYSKYDRNNVISFYDKLKEQFSVIDKQKQFFLQMSWGTGWRAKTIDLAMDIDTFNDVINEFNLDKGSSPNVFPKTRRLTERGNVPEMPLGWVRVDLM